MPVELSHFVTSPGGWNRFAIDDESQLTGLLVFCVCGTSFRARRAAPILRRDECSVSEPLASLEEDWCAETPGPLRAGSASAAAPIGPDHRLRDKRAGPGLAETQPAEHLTHIHLKIVGLIRTAGRCRAGEQFAIYFFDTDDPSNFLYQVDLATEIEPVAGTFQAVLLSSSGACVSSSRLSASSMSPFGRSAPKRARQ